MAALEGTRSQRDDPIQQALNDSLTLAQSRKCLLSVNGRPEHRINDDDTWPLSDLRCSHAAQEYA